MEKEGKEVMCDTYIVALHQLLMPPTAVATFDTEVQSESYARQIASADGIELLRLNWRSFLEVFFPLGDLESCEEDEEETRPVEEMEDGVPIRSENLTDRVIKGADLRELREPGVLDRVHYSYIVVLRFFGWRLHDDCRGVLDRHRNWKERYECLSRCFESKSASLPERDSPTEEWTVSDAVRDRVALCDVPQSPTYETFNFYDSLLRVIQSFLTIGLITFAVRLVEFIIEEMKNERLPYLYDWCESSALPLIIACDAVDQSHKTRLKGSFYKLNHSDSD